MPRATSVQNGDDERGTAVRGGEWGDEASTTVEQGQLANKLAPLPPTKPGNVNPHTGHVTQTGAGLDEMTVDDHHAREVLSAITPLRPETNVARLVITAGNDAGQQVEVRPGKSYTIGRAIDNDVVLTDISVSRKHFDLKYEDGAWVVVDRGSGNGTVVNGNLEDNPFVLATNDVIEIGNTVFRFEQPNGVPRASAPTFDLDEVDEESSTIAGKGLREAENTPPPERQPIRPKTLPPPAPTGPPRMTHASAPPPASTFPLAMGQQPPMPASTMPLPQMANRPPLGDPNARTLLGDPMGMPMGMPLGIQKPPQPQHLSTLPGQPQARPSYPYPQAGPGEIPPHSVHAQMLLIQQNNARRGDLSTAHVPPVPYNPMPMGVDAGYGRGQLSRRTKLIIAGVGLAILTGVVTAAVLKSDKKPATTASAKIDPAKPIAQPALAKQDPPKQEPPKASVPVPVVAKVDPPKQDTNKPGEPTLAKQDVPKQDAAKPIEPPKEDPAKQIASTKQDVPKQIKTEPKHDTKAEAKHDTKTERRHESHRDPPQNTSKRVAVDSDSAKSKADSLYRAKNFAGAAKVLADAAKSADEDDAKELRKVSDLYAKLGKVYAKGMAPAQKATDAFEALQAAANFDGNVGGAFDEEIENKLAQVAPKAAVSYLAQQQYARARSALITAQHHGSSDSNLSLVKQKLESVAGELYNEASKELASNPASAKEKLRQVKQYVDSKSPWAVKADALLKKSG